MYRNPQQLMMMARLFGLMDGLKRSGPNSPSCLPVDSVLNGIAGLIIVDID
jgi:hypothetical protein